MSALPPPEGGGAVPEGNRSSPQHGEVPDGGPVPREDRPWGLPSGAPSSGWGPVAPPAPGYAPAPGQVPGPVGQGYGFGQAYGQHGYASAAGVFADPVQSGQWRPPPRPGVVPLRPLGLGELLDGSVQTMRQNPRVMLGLSAAVMALVGLLSTVAMVLGLPQLLSALDTPEEIGADEVAGIVGGSFAGFVVPALLQALAIVVLSGILILAVSEAVLGRRPTVGQVWRRAWRRIPALIGLSLLTATLSVLGLAVLIGPGIALLAVSGEAGAIGLLVGVPLAVVLAALLFVRFAFAAPALLLEELGILAALRRSWRLVRGSWWRVLGVLLLTSFIAAAANGLLQAPFAILGSVIAAAVAPADSGSAEELRQSVFITSLTGNIGTVIASTVSAPFSAAVTALLYIDLRIRREGLDVALARAAAEE